MFTIFSSITVLKGIADKRAENYAKLKIATIYDLIYHFPRGYINYSSSSPILDIELNTQGVVRGTITKKMREQTIRRGLTVYKAVATDDMSDFEIIFYNNRYGFDALKENETYLFYGKISGGFLRREINSPHMISAYSTKFFQPIYPLTEGITNTMFHTNIDTAIGFLKDTINDFDKDILPKEFLLEYKLCTLQFALENIHSPIDEHSLAIAKKRLGFDELLVLQLGLLMLKGRNHELTGHKMKPVPLANFVNSLPFKLTNAQTNSINEIVTDLCKEVPMNRLLQGDVGSGKTAVAAAAAYVAHINGCQTALMAPTEILATQHFHTLTAFFEPLGINVCLLKGSLTAKKKTMLKEKIALGEFSVVIGTHALVQQSTTFNKLGLVITDEQHRFGVVQRTTLAEKGDNPHKLVMSATPIPRTLGLIIYGDLDISILDELPKGRIPIETYAVTGKLRQRAFTFIKNHLDEGMQAYIVCPLIEDSDTNNDYGNSDNANGNSTDTAMTNNQMLAVKSYFEQLSNGEFSNYSVGLLHGKMPSADKDSVMNSFKSGKIQLLISTTVIEVGVDIPNAVIMLIENADRFGLSQLHQLRGRVGRGEHKSYCILVTNNVNDDVKFRLKIMSDTSDGFKIAEEDLRLRGCGDFFGERQHGLPPLKIAELDRETITQTQITAKKIFAEGRNLPNHPGLLKCVERLYEFPNG